MVVFTNIFLGVITFSFILAWLTIKSGSLWPAVILHGMDNLTTQQLFAPFSWWKHDIILCRRIGLIPLLVTLIFAIIFWMFRDRLPDLRIKIANKSIE